jgi:transcriptional regulator with XRE-family HTH domain
MNINQKIAAKFHELRLQRNILQSAVAEELGMSQNAYYMLENGTTRIIVEKLLDISIYFKMPISYFFDIPENIIKEEKEDSVYNERLFNEQKESYEKTITELNKTISSQNKIIELLMKEKI